MKSYRGVTDPDHPAYSDDALEDFAAHTARALEMVEAIMDKVTAWSEDGGAIICQDCAEDAREGGARLKQARVLRGRVCDYCGQEIGNND